MLEWVLIFALLTIIIILFHRYSILKVELKNLKKQSEDKEKDLKEQIENLRGQIKELSEQVEYLETEGKDEAIKRSMSTIIGKVGEHLAPIVMFLNFQNYGINLKDFRFIGGPIDFIAFKGLTEENPEEIYFIEVKSGNTVNLTETQRKIKDIVEAKKVKWLTIHLPSEINTTQNTSETQQLSTENSRMHESIEQDTSQASTVKTVMLPTGEEVILSKDGSELGRMHIDKNAIHVTPSLKFNEEISPFKPFLIDRVLEGMRRKDIESGKKEGEALFYEIIKDANNNVKELIIRNVDTCLLYTSPSPRD